MCIDHRLEHDEVHVVDANSECAKIFHGIALSVTVGVICSGTLYIANVGDSRAVLGRLVRATGEVLAIQLSTEHNASIEFVRQELRSLHPDDPHIVVLKHNVWRVKGLDMYPSLRVAYIDEVEEPSKDASKKINQKVYYSELVKVALPKSANSSEAVQTLDQ
ncbi:putative protein phosphatase 2C 72 [Camellia lanceoleosa]|uniref:Uncharacterized protein n=1 Tax=Camellia lanceoleosa TaxID=1840588 RepID=A0ACC0HC50_9ERIC|nr:putative protein phosphatase 2C 72 [Camellia lanceoleosa]